MGIIATRSSGAMRMCGLLPPTRFSMPVKPVMPFADPLPAPSIVHSVPNAGAVDGVVIGAAVDGDADPQMLRRA